MIRYKILLLLFASPLFLSGCTGVGMLTSAAAVTGISAAQEGGLPRAVSDARIKILINEAWFQYNVDAFRKLSTRINQGRVLITGVVQNPEHRVESVRLAWRVKGVKQVMNEVRVADSEGITGFVKDRWITSRLRASLLFNRGVQSINYSVDTVLGVVYLMGVAQNQAELNLVIETARTISGVKQVVSYVKLAGEPLEGEKKEEALVETTVPTQPQKLQVQNNQSHTVKNYGSTVSGTNLKTRVEPVEDISVPARRVPDNAPSIEDQYYN